MRRAPALILLTLLAAASIAAVLAVTRIERAGSPVGRPILTRAFSPNGDGYRDAATVTFRLRRADEVILEVVDDHGHHVANLIDGTRQKAGPVLAKWDGHRIDRHGPLAPAGRYHVRIALLHQHRMFEGHSYTQLDVTPPEIESAKLDLSRASLHVVRVDVVSRGQAADRWLELDGHRLQTLRIRRPAAERAARSYGRFRISARVRDDVTAADLTGSLRVVLEDAAGNRTSEVAR